MKHIYIILTNTNTKISKFLRLFTKDEYNHVSIAFKNNCEEMYSFARRIVWFPWIAGFIKESVNQGVLARHPETKCLIYDLSVSDENYEIVLSRLEKFLSNPQKYKYSFINIALMFFDIPYERENFYVCSNFVSHLLNDVVNFEKDISLVKPCDYKKLNLDSVYEGTLRDFVYSGGSLTATLN